MRFQRHETLVRDATLRTLHRQGTFIVRTVARKTPDLNQAKNSRLSHPRRSARCHSLERRRDGVVGLIADLGWQPLSLPWQSPLSHRGSSVGEA